MGSSKIPKLHPAMEGELTKENKEIVLKTFKTFKLLADILAPFVDDPKAKDFLIKFTKLKESNWNLTALLSLLGKKTIGLPFMDLDEIMNLISKQFIMLERAIPPWANPILEAGQFALQKLNLAQSPYRDEKDFQTKSPLAYQFYYGVINLTALAFDMTSTAADWKDSHVVTKQLRNLGGLLSQLGWYQRTGAGTFSGISMISKSNLEKQRFRFLLMLDVAETQHYPHKIFAPLQNLLTQVASPEIANLICDDKIFNEISKFKTDNHVTINGQKRAYFYVIENRRYDVMFGEIKRLMEQKGTIEEKKVAEKTANRVAETALVMLQAEYLSFKASAHFDFVKAKELIDHVNEFKNSFQYGGKELFEEILDLKNHIENQVAEQIQRDLQGSAKKLNQMLQEEEKNPSLVKKFYKMLGPKQIKPNSEEKATIQKAMGYLEEAMRNGSTPEKILELVNKADDLRPRNDATVNIFDDLKKNLHALYVVTGTDVKTRLGAMHKVIRDAHTQLQSLLKTTKSFTFRGRNLFTKYNHLETTKDISDLIQITMLIINKLFGAKNSKEITPDYDLAYGILARLQNNPALKKHHEQFRYLEQLIEASQDLLLKRSQGITKMP